MEIVLKEIKDIEYFSKGKRGVIYTGSYKGKKVAIKVKRPESTAENRIENETRFLKILNKHKIGPKFIMFKDNKLVYEFVEGTFIDDYVASEKNDRKKVIKVLKASFLQCYEMDKLRINKEEMMRPFKHIIVGHKGKPVMIDFERCHNIERPQNTTQFCQYMISGVFVRLLTGKGIIIDKEKMIKAAQKYKSDMNKKNFEEIMNLIA